MIWKGSWLHTQRIRARRLQMLAFPHTPQAGDRIPVGRPSRKLWWMSEQTTSSWWLRRLPSTFTPLTPSEEKPSLFLFYFPLFDLVALWHISIDNACLDCHAFFLFSFRTGRTYSYLFSEPNRLGGTAKPYPSWVGADHADDLQYVFGKPFTTPLGYWPRHRHVSGYMIAYWTNFAKTGYS